MRKTKKCVSSLLLFSLIAALCLSACEGSEPDAVPRVSTEADVERDRAGQKPIDASEPGSPSDVLKQYSNLFIASKVTSSLNLRDEPSTNGAVIGKIAKNAGGEILEDLGKWFRVRSGGIEGYAASKYCVSGKKARNLAPSAAVRMTRITAASLNVRSGPGNDFAILTQLGPADHLPVVKELDEWYQIRFYNGLEGYIRKDYAETGWYLPEAVPLVSLKRQKLLRYAEQFVGIPYKLGGTSLDGDGIDCSNFVHECLKNALGIGLDRTAGQLASRGYKVTLSDAEPGDLMFYADETGKINHVAIYMGNGKIIHASLTFGQVAVSAYNYKTEPVLVKNVIGD